MEYQRDPVPSGWNRPGHAACSVFGGKAPSGGPGVRQHSVLVVDDEASVRALYVDALEESGHRVSIAIDGEMALEQLREGNLPCVVLSDVRMPRMDGFELTRALADDPQLASVPIVVLT